MKFKYDYLNNLLWKVGEEYNYEISDDQTFTTLYGGQGFILDSNQPNHWINFTIYSENIRAFYKKVDKINGEETIIYYQKDLPRKEIIEFELTKDDIVAKRNGRWVKNEKNN